MEKEFVPYAESKALKELGFDEECFGYYDVDGGYKLGHAFCYSSDTITNQPKKGCLAPLWQQAFRWIRDKYELHSYIEGSYPWFRYYINSNDNRWEGFKELKYEQAELFCLRKLIEILYENK